LENKFWRRKRGPIEMNKWYLCWEQLRPQLLISSWVKTFTPIINFIKM
jgi:hypothetical protein